MKKITLFLISLLIVGTMSTNVSAGGKSLAVYQEALNELNKEYNTNFVIIDEETYQLDNFENIYNKTYEEYIQNILSTHIEDFRNSFINSIIEITTKNVEVSTNGRSSYGEKSVAFNSGKNSMTLNYKYSGITFDTSYKPKASVKRLNNTNFFNMKSYTSSFKNSNRTCSVIAKGDIITAYGMQTGVSFTVNFNL